MGLSLVSQTRGIGDSGFSILGGLGAEERGMKELRVGGTEFNHGSRTPRKSWETGHPNGIQGKARDLR